jgi:hypothetical protein
VSFEGYTSIATIFLGVTLAATVYKIMATSITTNDFPTHFRKALIGAKFYTKVGENEYLPKILSKVRTTYGWEIKFTLPPGKCMSDLEAIRENLENYTDSELRFTIKQGTVTAKAFTNLLPDKLIVPSHIKQVEVIVNEQNEITQIIVED